MNSTFNQSARFSDIMDAHYGYQLFLGRMPESREARLAKANQPIDIFIRGFLQSEEFLVGVATPLLEGHAVSGERFCGKPSQRLRNWVANRLLQNVSDSEQARQAGDWTGLFRVALNDSAVVQSLAELGPHIDAEALAKSLVLRKGGLSTTSIAKPDPRLQHGPAISILRIVEVGEALEGLADLADKVLAQTYSRWELVFAGCNIERAESMLSGFAALDPRIKVAIAEIQPASPVDLALLAYDLCAGEYMCLINAPVLLKEDFLESLALAAFIHDRPEILSAESFCTNISSDSEMPGEVEFLRVDAAARAGLFAPGREAGVWPDLVARVTLQGTRVRVASTSLHYSPSVWDLRLDLLVEAARRAGQ